MKKLLPILLLLPSLARAQITGGVPGSESGNITTETARATAAENLRVLKAGDTMTGQLTNTSTLTVQGNAFSVGASTFIVVGGSVTVGGPFFSVGGTTLVVTNGRVGVNTASPTQPLYVNGTAYASNFQTPGAMYNSGNANNSRVSLTSKGVVIDRNVADNSPVLVVNNIMNSSGPLTNWQINGSTVVSISSNGWVGVGTVSPVANLDVNGAANVSGQFIAVGTATVQGSAFSVGGSTLVVTGGKVGIGTTTPATTLDVNGSAQFGSGATKSTFTATGSLTLDPSATFVMASTATIGRANFFVRDSSMTFSAVDAATMTLSNRFNIWECSAQWATTTSTAMVVLNLSGDTGANYYYYQFSTEPTACAAAPCVVAAPINYGFAQTLVKTIGTSQSNNAAYGGSSTIKIFPAIGTTRVVQTRTAYYDVNGYNVVRNEDDGQYQSATVSSISLHAVGGIGLAQPVLAGSIDCLGMWK